MTRWRPPGPLGFGGAPLGNLFAPVPELDAAAAIEAAWDAGVRFFEEREAHARRVSDCDIAAFCAVQRAADHPARPADAVPLDAFWRNRGFTPYPALTCEMSWKEVDAAEATPHRLAFWLKSLTGGPLP